MERVIVAYHVLDKDGNVDENDENAFQLITPLDKEVVLMDILKHFAILYKGIDNPPNFNYFAMMLGDKRISLTSPSAVVPVVDGQIRLVLEESSAPPVVPLFQLGHMQEVSREEIYQGYRYDPSNIEMDVSEQEISEPPAPPP